MHEVSDAGEASADAATGVQVREVFGSPTAAATDFESERVAESEHDRCGGGGSEVEPAGFGGDAGVEKDVAGLGERGRGAAGERNERDGEALERGEQAEEFFGFAAVGEGDDGVARCEHAHVAVDGFRGMEEVRWSAGRTEGCGDLAGDDAALADAGDDDAALACRCCDELIDRLGEGREHGGVEAEGELVEGGGLDAHEG